MGQQKSARTMLNAEIKSAGVMPGEDGCIQARRRGEGGHGGRTYLKRMVYTVIPKRRIAGYIQTVRRYIAVP